MTDGVELKIYFTADGKGLKGTVKNAKGEVKDFNTEVDKSATVADRAKKSYAGWKAALVGLGIGTLIRQVYDVNAEFERLQNQLLTVTGSTELAVDAFAAIQEFAANTPYSVQQVTTAFNKLVSMGLEPSEKALIAYGNTASGMGKSLDQMIEAVADAAVGEFERLKEFGIKARSEGDNVSFTFKGVTTTVKKEADAIEGYLIKLGQTEFAGGLERQAGTLTGAMSNLGDAWDHLLDRMLSDKNSSAIQDWIRSLGDALNYVADEGVTTFQKVFISGIGAVEKAFVSLRATSLVVWEVIKAAGQGAINIIMESMSGLIGGLGDVFDALGMTKIGDMLDSVSSSLAPLSSAYDDLNQKIISITAARDADIQMIDKSVLATFKNIDSSRDQAKSLDEIAAALERKAKSTNQAKKEIMGLSEEMDVMSRAMDLIDKQFEKMDQDEAASFAGLAESVEDSVRKTTSALSDLTDTGVTGFEDLRNTVEGWSRSFSDAMLSSEKGFSGFIDTMLDQLARITLAKATEPLFNAFASMLEGAFSTVGASFQYGTNIGSEQSTMLAAQDNWFANGGIMTGAGSLPLHRYGDGGVVNKPQLFVAGEKYQPEAIVPLPDGRAIPVSFTNPAIAVGGGGASNNINMAIEIKNSGSAKEVAGTEQRFDGEQWVTSIILKDQHNGGPITSGFGNTFGLSRGFG